jgi:hypothetical protein
MSSRAINAEKVMSRSLPPGGLMVVVAAVIHGLVNVTPLGSGGTMWVEKINVDRTSLTQGTG